MSYIIINNSNVKYNSFHNASIYDAKGMFLNNNFRTFPTKEEAQKHLDNIIQVQIPETIEYYKSQYNTPSVFHTECISKVIELTEKLSKKFQKCKIVSYE